MIGPLRKNSQRVERTSLPLSIVNPEASLLKQRSCLAAALGVTKFITIIAMCFGHTLLCCLSPT
jgi:hypothetical protein